jgi:glycosyltransferase involved in cell wall biosynthesis
MSDGVEGTSRAKTSVLVDLTQFHPNRTGGAQRFVLELFRRLDKDPSLALTYGIRPEAHEWVLNTVGLEPNDVVVVAPARSAALSYAISKRRIREMSFSIGSDVVFSPLNLPVLRTHGKEVLTVHDLAPRYYLRSHLRAKLSMSQRIQMRARLAQIARGLRSAAHVLTDTAAIGAELAAFASVDAKPVLLGGDSEAVLSAKKRWQPGNLDGGAIVLVSSTRPHKNLEILRSVASSPALFGKRFELVGLEGAHSDERFPPNVDVLGAVSETDLIDVLTSASCLFSPSHYEGFGLPVAEAMHLGVPVVLSDISVHRELAGEGGRYFGSRSPTEAASALHETLTSEESTHHMAGILRSRSTRLTWDRCAEQYSDLLRA